MKIYLIALKDSDLKEFWSNEWGWVGLNEASVFDATDKETMSLPVEVADNGTVFEGQWVEFSTGGLSHKQF